MEVNRRDEPLLAAGAAAQVHLKKILVPVDFSECSRKALRYALALAKQYSSALALVYVAPAQYYVASGYSGADIAELEARMRESGERELAALAKQIQEAASAETLVRSGSPGPEIVEAARSASADLIVISTHGRTGLKHVLLGSVAEFVTRHAPCPVLVVRENEREFVAN